MAFRTKLETLTNQFSDSKQHVDVLKESLTAKEQRAAILQTEVQLTSNNTSCSVLVVLLIANCKCLFPLTLRYILICVYAQVDALRLRLEEKESLLSKKSEQISELTEEKSTQHGEITDLKDMLDVKERKVNVLQKKVKKRERERKNTLGISHLHNTKWIAILFTGNCCYVHVDLMSFHLK